jgi:type IV pilus assembly protein PilW
MKTAILSRSPFLPRRALPQQDGVTLIELMIALLLGLFVVVGVLGIFTANREASRANENLARIQENARVTFDLIGRSIREADGNPCFRTRERLTGDLGEINLNKALPSPVSWDTDIDVAVRGYAVGATLPTGANGGIEVADDSDSIILLSGTTNASPVVFDPTASTVTLLPHTHPTTEAGNYILCHQQGGIAYRAPANSIPVVSGVYAPPAGLMPSATSTGWLAELTAEAWFVGKDATLYRTFIGPGFSGTEPIIRNVEHMELRYLVDDYDDATPAPTRYISAGEVGDDNWPFVRAVSVTLELRSAENIAPTTGTDRKLQRTLMHIASIRNRLP